MLLHRQRCLLNPWRGPLLGAVGVGTEISILTGEVEMSVVTTRGNVLSMTIGDHPGGERGMRGGMIGVIGDLKGGLLEGKMTCGVAC